jgi:hypothetical protein
MSESPKQNLFDIRLLILLDRMPVINNMIRYCCSRGRIRDEQGT